MFDIYSRQLKPFSQFGDARVNRVFPNMIEQLGENFGKSIPQSAQDNAQMQSFYGFFFQPVC